MGACRFRNVKLDMIEHETPNLELCHSEVTDWT